jgi:hypothetical protein
MHSTFPQLLDEGGQTEMYKGKKRHIFVTFFPEIPQRVTSVSAECVTVEYTECTFSVQCANELY